jgi:phosphatidylinositol N-acetylglucosaminyltransferase subunit P
MKGGIFNSKKKGPKAEVYGFVIWFSSFILFIFWLIWACVPDEILHKLHITFYPDKYWSILIPMYLFVSCIVFYCFMNFYHHWRTLPLDSIHTIKDEFSLPVEDEDSKNFLPKYSDISIEEVNKSLYLK